MVTRTKDEEILYWYRIMRQFSQEKTRPYLFCQKHNLDRLVFDRRRRLILYEEIKGSKAYNEELSHYNEQQNSGLSQSEYCAKVNKHKFYLHSMSAHMSFMERVNLLLNEDNLDKTGKVDEPMSFIKAPAVIPTQSIPQQELITKKNSIEISISEGIRVLVDEGVCSTKILKIIDLLRDI